MKKKYTIFIALLMLHLANDTFAQEDIIIEYTPDLKEFNTDLIDKYSGIKKNEYQYVFTNVNSALHSIKPKPTYVRKVTSIPEVLKIFPVTRTAKEENINIKKGKSLILPVSPADPIIAELKTLQEEFETLKSIVERSEDAFAVLNKHWRLIPICIAEGNDAWEYVVQELGLPKGSDSTSVRNELDERLIEFVKRSSYLRGHYESEYKKHQSNSILIPVETIDRLAAVSAQNDYVIKDRQDFYISLALLSSMKNCTDKIDSESYNIKGDYTRLNVTMLKNNYFSKSDTLLKQEILTYRRKYIKVDFTTGFFYNGLVQNVYYLENSSEKKISEQKTHNWDIAAGALVHAKYAFTSKFKGGPAAGAAVSVLDGKTRLLLGISAILGRRNEFAFTGGVALSKLPALLDGYEVEDVLPTHISAVPTYDKWHNAIFFGISYSLINN